MSLPVAMVEWIGPAGAPIPGKCVTAGLLVGNNEDVIVLCQSEYIEGCATEGEFEIPWNYVTDAWTCLKSARITRPEQEGV